MLFESMNYPVVPEPKLRQSKPIIPLTTNQGRMFQLQKLDLTDRTKAAIVALKEGLV